MPGGDRRGPMGQGLMTGRGGGYCMTPYYGRGLGPGHCRGHFYPPAWAGPRGSFEATAEEAAEGRLKALREEQRWLEDHLKALRGEGQQAEKE